MQCPEKIVGFSEFQIFKYPDKRFTVPRKVLPRTMGATIETDQKLEIAGKIDRHKNNERENQV